MNFRRIKHMLLRLSPEEKLAGAGAIVVLVSAFLPWLSIQFSSVEESATMSGFAGDLGVIGFVVFLLTALAALFLVSRHLNLKIPDFGFRKEQIVLFLMGESAFLLLLTIAVYTKRSLEYTSAEMRFGLYAALIGAVAGTFAAFAQTQKNQKKETEAFFSHPEEAKAETRSGTSEPSEPIEEPEYQEQDYLPKKEEAPVKPPDAEQKSFFYEKTPDDTAEAESDAVETVQEPSESRISQSRLSAEVPQKDLPTDEPQEMAREEKEEEKTESDVTAEPYSETGETPASRTAEEASQKEEMPEKIISDVTAEAESDTVETVQEPSEGAHSSLGEDGRPEDETATGMSQENEPEEKPQEKPETVSSAGTMNQGDYLVREAGVQPKKNVKVDVDSIRPVEKKKKPETKNMSFYDDL